MRSTLSAMFPRKRPYTNRALPCTCDCKGRCSLASSWRERALSRTGWISKHSQMDVDSSGKALSSAWTCSYWLWLMTASSSSGTTLSLIYCVYSTSLTCCLYCILITLANSLNNVNGYRASSRSRLQSDQLL